MEALKSTFLFVKYSVPTILIEWTNLLGIKSEHWMSRFLNIRSSRLKVSYKKVFLKLLQNHWKYQNYHLCSLFYMHPLCQSFFSQLTFGLLNPYFKLTRVSCCFNFRNHTPKNCVIAFLDPLIRKHVTHAMHINVVPTCLEY